MSLWTSLGELSNHLFDLETGVFKLTYRNALFWLFHFQAFLLHYYPLMLFIMSPLFGRVELSGVRIYPTISHTISDSYSLIYMVDERNV